MTYEQLLVHVFSQNLHLGELATRPAVEEDADSIADTVAGLLAAMPQFDGPWEPGDLTGVPHRPVRRRAWRDRGRLDPRQLVTPGVDELGGGSVADRLLAGDAAAARQAAAHAADRWSW